jgi:hypothetical protein
MNRMSVTHDDIVYDLSLLSPDATEWCLTHVDGAERLTTHALREFPTAGRADLARILGLAVHVAARESVERALQAMGGPVAQPKRAA